MCLLSSHVTVIMFHVSVRSWTSASDNHPLTRAPRALPPQRPALLPEQKRRNDIRNQFKLPPHLKVKNFDGVFQVTYSELTDKPEVVS